MKFVGGYDLPIEGKPSDDVTEHQFPEVLYLPLFSRSFDYSALQVENGDTVTKGQILATDPTNFFAPLLAPAAGTVNLDQNERHITLENLSSDSEGPPLEEVTPDNRRQMMMRLGIWPLMTRVDTGRMPDPERSPEVLLVTIAQSEPFYPSPQAVLAGKTDRFVAGLEQLHRLFDEASIHLILQESQGGIETELRESLKECGDWVTVHQVEDRYPGDNPALVARALECEQDAVWTLDAQAVLACDQALNHSLPHVTRIVTVSGPVISAPAHHQVPLGYPLATLVSPGEDREVRMIDGGVFTGAAISADQQGLDTQCVSLTCLEEVTSREVLAFAQIGFDKHSYSKTFASLFKPLFKEKYTTSLRGEARPCVNCGACEDVCPAELMPFLIYRYLSKDRLEDACRVGLESCVECGLCSYVCLSKIEHLKLFREERRKCEDEKDSRE